jgi:four helix bundle protein
MEGVKSVRGQAMGEIRSFRDLRVWQQGMDLVEQVYRITQGFPQSEVYGLSSQLRRAAGSVPSNIAEGHSSAHLKEYLRYLSLARASLAEVETHLEISQRLKYSNKDRVVLALQACDCLSRQLQAPQSALRPKAVPSKKTRN